MCAKHHVRVEVYHGYVEHCCTGSESAPVVEQLLQQATIDVGGVEIIHVRLPQAEVATCIFNTG